MKYAIIKIIDECVNVPEIYLRSCLYTPAPIGYYRRGINDIYNSIDEANLALFQSACELESWYNGEANLYSWALFCASIAKKNHPADTVARTLIDGCRLYRVDGITLKVVPCYYDENGAINYDATLFEG